MFTNVLNCIIKPTLLVWICVSHICVYHVLHFTVCVSVNDVKYRRCFCIKTTGYWLTTGCPPGLIQVVECPPKKPKKGETCCAMAERKEQSKYKSVYNKQSSDNRPADNNKPIHEQIKERNKHALHNETPKLPKSPKQKSNTSISKRRPITRMFKVFDG